MNIDDIPIRGIDELPRKPLVIKELPTWTQDAPRPVVSVSILDKATLYFHEKIEYAKWAMVLLSLVIRTIRIIQNAKELK